MANEADVYFLCSSSVLTVMTVECMTKLSEILSKERNQKGPIMLYSIMLSIVF
jgi:hypothetical protein